MSVAGVLLKITGAALVIFGGGAGLWFYLGVVNLANGVNGGAGLAIHLVGLLFPVVPAALGVSLFVAGNAASNETPTDPS